MIIIINRLFINKKSLLLPLKLLNIQFLLKKRAYYKLKRISLALMLVTYL